MHGDEEAADEGERVVGVRAQRLQNAHDRLGLVLLEDIKNVIFTFLFVLESSFKVSLAIMLEYKTIGTQKKYRLRWFNSLSY